MKNVIKYIIENLNTASLKKYSEEVKVVDFIIEITDSACITKELLKELLLSIPSRDEVEVTVTNEAEYGIQITPNSNLDLLEWDVFNGEPISMSWHIDKNISDNNIVSIYSYNDFCSSIEKREILEVMMVFSHLLQEKEKIYFEVLDQEMYFVTKSICFVSDYTMNFALEGERKEILNKVKENANFRNGLMYPLLPSDFSFQLSGSKNKLEEYFAKIETFLAICYIANDSEIVNGEKVVLNISGQRNVSMEIQLKDIIANKEIVKINNWIYEGGNTTDKAIIARNIISLHCRYSNLLTLDGKTFSSIQSNFNLYQKDNVDRYLSLKNEVGKSVTDIIEKASELALSIPNGMKNNVLAVFSFLFTVILANVVSDAPLDNIFTRDITVIFEVILAFSVLFLIFNVYETNYKIKQMKIGFRKLKSNYVEIFDEEELKELINEDDFEKEIIQNIKKQRNWAIGIWIMLLFVLFIIVEMISSSSTSEWIVNLLIRLKEIKK